MKKKIVCLSCVKQKRFYATTAENMYTSPYFRYNLKYAKMLKPDIILILSAKYHVLQLTDTIKPYEKTLNKMPVNQVKTWSGICLKEFKKIGINLKKDEFIFLTGDAYHKHLIKQIKHHSIPFKGLGLGYKLQKLKQLTGG